MKRRHATKHGTVHGNKKSKLHEDDVEKNKALRAKRRNDPREPRDAIPQEKEPVFSSDVSGLDSPGCYRVENGVLIPMEGQAWETSLWETCLHFNWYHQKQIRRNRKGTAIESYKRRKIKDRVVLSKTDKHARPETDVMRETIDLRPDHSRVIQYMLQQGLKDEAAATLEEARYLKIRLFQKIYERWGLFVGDHDDSGQHHDDLWHTGIQEDETHLIRGKEKGKFVNRLKRERTPFLSYGVGIGAASWSRHFSALRDAGVSEKEIKSFANLTMAALEEDTLKVHERHNCRPRDVRLLSVLDRLVHRQLKRLAPEFTEKANSEYAQFLQDNYCAGKIGVKKSKHGRIRQLEAELALENERSNKLNRDLIDERAKAKKTEDEFFAVLNHLNPNPHESTEDAARRVVRERDEVKAQLALVKIAVVKLFHELGELGASALKTLAATVMAALCELGTLLGVKTEPFDKMKDSPPPKGQEPQGAVSKRSIPNQKEITNEME